MSWGGSALESGPGGLLVGYLADDEHRPKSAAIGAAMTGCIPYLQQERYIVSGDDRGPEIGLPMDAYGNHYVPYQTTTTAYPPHSLPHPQMFQFEERQVVCSDAAGTYSAAEYVPIAVERDAIPPLESAETSYGGGDPKVTLDPYYAETVDVGALVTDTSDCPVVHSSYELERENGRDVTGGESDALHSLVDMSVTVETVTDEQGNVEGGYDLSTAVTRGNEVEPTSGADFGSGTTSVEHRQAEEDSAAVDAGDRASLVQCSLAEGAEEQ